MLQHDLGTCEWLAEELTRSHLFTAEQLDPVVTEFRADSPYADANALAEHLVGRGLLSQFQAGKALDGEAKSLVLGPYELRDTLGTGSLGAVYRARGRADRLGYALKVVPLRNTLNVRLARKQVKDYADLRHPGLVPIVDVGTAANYHYLVWPLAEGEPLDARLQRVGRLSPDETVRLAEQVAEALRACHRAGLFHGLLKPSNVMLGPDGTVRLLDCGLGALLADDPDERIVDTMSSAQAMAGMLDFLAPECSLDPANRTPAADLYSLGCLLYTCLAGRCPFAESGAFEKLIAHQKQTPKPLRELNPAVSEELAAVVARLMHKDPDGRYASAGELLRALEESAAPPVPDEIFDEAPPQARSESIWEMEPAPPPRWSLWRWLMGVLGF